MLRALLLWLSARPGMGRLLLRAPASRRLVRRFVAGDTLAEVLEVLAHLESQGFLTAVTCLGEHVNRLEAAREATHIYLQLLDQLRARGLGSTPSVKLTQLGLELGAVARDHLEAILTRAGDTVVWVDMEGSAYTEPTLALYRALRVRWKNVACVLQAYLRRTEADLRSLVGAGLVIRLCKGAYREPPTVAYRRRAEVDRQYARLAGMLLSPETLALGVYPAFATHDERLIDLVLDRAAALGVGRAQFEVQMLYGVRAELQARLRREGVRVRVLVPFGRDWYAYLVRRLAERPANLLFVARQLVRP